MKKMFNAQRLTYFQQVVMSGSVRAAADILGVDPSSISRSIALLEEESGLRLLQRQGRGVVPTETGKLLAAYARQQMELLDNFYGELDQLQQGQRGQINIGVGEGMLDMFFYPVITDYMRSHSHITLNLVVGSSEQNASELLDDRIDIALLYSPFNDVRFRVHGNRPASPIQAITHKNHPLTQIRRPLLLSDLAPYPGAALHQNFGLSQYIKAAELSEQVVLNNVLTTSSYRALWHFANAGLGYTLCSSLFSSLYHMPDVVELPMANPILNRCNIAIITRSGRHLPTAAISLLEHLIRYLQQYAGTSSVGAETSSSVATRLSNR